jgi:hypothetical protein
MVSVGMPYPHFIEPAGCKKRDTGQHIRAIQSDAALRETAFPVFPFAAAGKEDDTAQMPKPGPPVAGEADAASQSPLAPFVYVSTGGDLW